MKRNVVLTLLALLTAGLTMGIISCQNENAAAGNSATSDSAEFKGTYRGLLEQGGTLVSTGEYETYKGYVHIVAADGAFSMTVYSDSEYTTIYPETAQSESTYTVDGNTMTFANGWHWTTSDKGKTWVMDESGDGWYNKCTLVRQ